MPKSTRVLTGRVGIDALLVAGAAWMLWQVRIGTWNDPDPALTITLITRAAGGLIGVVMAMRLVEFVVHRRRGINSVGREDKHLWMPRPLICKRLKASWALQFRLR